MPNWFQASSQDVGVVVVVAVLTIALSVWQLVTRLIAVVPNTDVPVVITPPEQAARLPLGPGGDLVDVSTKEVLVTVSDLTPGAYAGVLGASVVWPVAMIVVAVLGIRVCRALLRGHVFIVANTRRVNAIAAVIVVGAVLHIAFETLQYNGVLAALAVPDEPTRISAEIDFLPFFAGLALATFAMAFNVGERLQRDSEGLV